MSDGNTLTTVTSATMVPSVTRRVSPRRPMGASPADAEGATNAAAKTITEKNPTSQRRITPPQRSQHDLTGNTPPTSRWARSGEPTRSTRPRTEAADLVDRDVGDEARRRIVRRRELRVRTDHRFGEFAQQFGCAALLDARGPGNRQVRRHRAAAVRGQDGEGDAVVTSHISDLLVF